MCHTHDKMELSKILEKSEVIWIYYLKDEIYFISLIYDFEYYILENLSDKELRIIEGFILRNKIESKKNLYGRKWMYKSDVEFDLFLEMKYFNKSLRELYD